ncbi:hypothetical protein DL96DRAFT_1607082 [Flagelloscypha sp. PMI_526]|nr:hypothetical protein DL96DRAFT_1607082 [Flagelloscypha sp. PMI_526]
MAAATVVSIASLVKDFNLMYDVGRYYLIDLFIEILGYGPVTIATVFALQLLWKRKTPGSHILFIIILTQWIANTWTVCFMVTEHVIFFSSPRYMLRNDETLERVANPKAQTTRIILGLVGQMGYDCTIVLANAVVIWRVWVIYIGNSFSQCLAGLWIVDLVLRLVTDIIWIANVDSPNLSQEDTATKLSLVYPLLTLATAILTTSALCLKSWRIRRVTRQSLQSSSNSPVRRVLVCLIEWGVVLCFSHLYFSIQAFVTAGLFTVSLVPQEVLIILTNFLTVIVTAHPALTALILSRGNNISALPQCDRTMASLRFAPRPQQRSDDGSETTEGECVLAESGEQDKVSL